MHIERNWTVVTYDKNDDWFDASSEYSSQDEACRCASGLALASADGKFVVFEHTPLAVYSRSTDIVLDRPYKSQAKK